MSKSDLEQVQGALVSLDSNRRRRMSKQFEKQLLALALEDRAGLVKLPPVEP